MGNFHQCKWCGGPLKFISNVGIADATSASHENLVAYCAAQEMKKLGVGRIVSGGIRIHADFYMPMAETRKCQKNCLPEIRCKKLHDGDNHYQRPDLDNLIKSLDGLNGVVFSDDCLICDIAARKYWAVEPRSEITVEAI